MNNSPQEIYQFLKADGDLLVVTHFFPDGDGIGSLTAFSGMLDQLEVKHTLAIDDLIPEKYNFLPGFERIRNLRVQPLDELFGRVAILDAGSIPRIGQAQTCIEPGAGILNIDHHLTGQYYGDLNLIDTGASATAEILYKLCGEFGLEIDQQIAYGLYVGILTDTGRFRFTNTTARSMSICGELLGKGVNPGWVTENIYYNLPFELVQALARSLLTIELHHGGLVCLIRLDHGHRTDDTEGFVEYASSIKGVALAAFLCEIDKSLFKVSLRSRSPVDVSAVARQFGGGGHLKAAGFRFQGGRAELIDRLLKEFGRQIEAHDLQPGVKFIDVAGDMGEPREEWMLEWSDRR